MSKDKETVKFKGQTYRIQDLPGSRAEAQEVGSPLYDAYRSCKRNHVTVRYTSDKSCMTCRHLQGTSEAKLQYNRQYARELRKDPEYLKREAIRAGRSNSKRRGGKVTSAWDGDDGTAVHYLNRNTLSEYFDMDLEVDHIICVELGGAHSGANVRVIPRTINIRKSVVERELVKLARAGNVQALKDRRQEFVLKLRQFYLTEAQAQEILDAANVMASQQNATVTV